MTGKFNISLACMLVASMATFNISAQKNRGTAPKRPSLVVGIVIDGLEYDRIEELREHFGQNGFNRLINKGITIPNLLYGNNVDETAATAIIFTGASPAVNGIPSGEYFDTATQRVRPVFLDPNTIGNFTDETFSPLKLKVSTIADELRIDTGGLGYVHAISADPGQALVMGGHAGNSACWINDKTGRWASSTFYTELPTVVQSINHRNPLSMRLDTLSWVPSVPEAAFASLPSYKKVYAFRHNYPRNDRDRYTAFKGSAPANSEITSVSAEYIKTLGLGKRAPSDMIAVNYSLQPYIYGKDADNRAETIDSYIRLDRDLERLFKTIDTDGPGMDNTLVFVAGTPVNPSSQRDDERWRIPTGDFSPARAVSLLNVDLMSLFGNGNWVTGYHDRQFYLNRDLIKSRGLSLDEMRKESADFLRRMSGVNYAATIDEVVSISEAIDSPFPAPRNICMETAGDIFIAVAPGWRILDEQNPESSVVQRASNTTSAAFLLYPAVEAQTLSTPVDARAIAPTVARLLRIRSPNGVQIPSLRF